MDRNQGEAGSYPNSDTQNKLHEIKYQKNKDNNPIKNFRSKKKIQYQMAGLREKPQVQLENYKENESKDESNINSQKTTKKQPQLQEKPSVNQIALKLPPIQSKNKANEISNQEQQKKEIDEDKINKRVYKQDEYVKESQKQMNKSSSNLIARLSKHSSMEKNICFLNIRGLSVSTNKEILKNKAVNNKQLKINKQQFQQEKQIKELKSTQQARQSKQESKKQLKNTLVRQVKRKSTVLKQEKKFNNSYLDFVYFINWTNCVQHVIEPIVTYKAWVGKGNNSILIKNSLKSRFWWNVIENQSNEVNLNWTQSRNVKCLQSLKKGQQLSNLIDKQSINYSEDEEQNSRLKKSKNKTFIFSLPKESKSKTYLLENNGLRKLASKKDLQHSKDNYSVEIGIGKSIYALPSPNTLRMHNHLEFNWNLSNKKALYYNLKSYYQACKKNPFEYIPVTFHVQNQSDKEWNNFVSYYSNRSQLLSKQKKQKEVILQETKFKKKKEKNVWIIKPGENSNRGCGIDVSDTIEGIREIIKTKGVRSNGKPRTHIIQSYIMPFLYFKRKFDIRCYIVVTSINDIIKAYWYQQGYIRTSSKQFTLKNLSNRMIHLTNDAVQKKSQDYGKFENANKISFLDFQKYLDNTYPESQYNFSTQVYPHMIQLAADAVRSTFLCLDSNKRQYSFEIFGLDFMIDQYFKVWLIEVNTNPCLELSSPLLARIIPSMIQNAFKIALDPIFPPQRQWPKKKVIPNDIFENNKFSLIFDSLQESKQLKKVLSPTNLANVIEIEQESDIEDQYDQE